MRDRCGCREIKVRETRSIETEFRELYVARSHEAHSVLLNFIPLNSMFAKKNILHALDPFLFYIDVATRYKVISPTIASCFSISATNADVKTLPPIAPIGGEI